MKRLILKSHLSPGDVLMLTAAVRDLHRAYPGRYLTDVRTSANALWEHNPHLTRLDEHARNVRVIEMHYPLIHESNSRPYHFIHGYVQFLEQQLGLQIPVTEFQGDIHLAPVEKQWMSQIEETGFRGKFWIIMAGGKFDFTTKWWNPNAYQEVVDHFAGRIQFVQCGEAHHWHPPLRNVINLIGKTDLRQFVRLMYHADGVVCPVTFAMHLAAAVETKPGNPKNRACVVIAGGREPAQWEAYPHHQFLSTNGALPCCDHGGCWKSRCQPVAGGAPHGDDFCVAPIHVSSTLQIPKCMHLITAQDVIRRIELYYEGGALRDNRA
ncbi:MAG: glycosyltransferase family 9 protein [Planctomycetaceae bacterium]